MYGATNTDPLFKNAIFGVGLAKLGLLWSSTLVPFIEAMLRMFVSKLRAVITASGLLGEPA